MKRILPFLLALPVAAYAFACSSSDSSTNNGSTTTDDAGTGTGDTNTGGDTTGDGGTTGDSTTDPSKGLTLSAVAAVGAPIDGIVYNKVENALYVALEGLSDPFTGGPTVQGKVLRIASDATISGVFGGTAATGDILSVGNHGGASNILALGNLQLVTVSGATDAGVGLQPGTVFASAVTASAGDDGGAGTFSGLKDLTVASDGSGFASEPNFNLGGAETRAERVYHFTATGTTTVVKHFDNAEHPNGIVLSPDGKTLYVGLNTPGGDPHYTSNPSIWKYTVATDGTLSGEAHFADIGTGGTTGTNAGQLAVDKLGNVYATSQGGVTVYKPTGETWGSIALPGNEAAASIAFGGADLNTLYIGAGNGGDATVYKAAAKVTGISK